MTLVAVAPNKFAKGFDGSGRTVPLAYEVLELGEALQRTYSTDAHLVTYVVESAVRQPRINKPGLTRFDGKVQVGVFFCDVDNPQHSAWTPDLIEAAMAQYDSLPVLQTAGIYHTEHGRRIVQPIAEPIPVQQVEPSIRRWLLGLECAGLPVDWACRDWTRHFRLPSVRRAGHVYRCPYLRLGQMQRIALEPILAAGEPAPVELGAPRPVVPVDWTSALPEIWRPRIQPIAEAVRGVPTEWHTLFMAIAGALLSRRVPHEHVPAICRAISLATGTDARTGDRELAARSTVQRHLAGLPTTGYSTLAATWPAVANALDAALAAGNEAHLRAQAAADPVAPPRTLAETTAALEDAIRRAPDGLTLISAECGLGKTAAAVRVAAERAKRPYASPTAKGERAPSQSKTAISVDKNALALQIAGDLAAGGTKVRRVFGPLSLRTADGKPVCRYHDVARPLVEGGQAMQWELCEGRGLEPCEHFETCPAKDCAEGPEDARVTIGPHALISVLDAAAGATGLLVIDEPPALLETVLLTIGDLETARRYLDDFEDRFEIGARPALSAVCEWTRSLGSPDVPTTLAALVRSCARAIDPEDLERAAVVTGASGDAVSCLAAANTPERLGRPPPLRGAALFRARRSVGVARNLGTASRVLGTLYRAAISKLPVAIRVEQRFQSRVMLVTFAREDLARALQREGAVVVSDANADLHLPVMAKVVGYVPPLHRFAAVDGASIERTLLRCRSATRKAWLKVGRLVVAGSLVSAVRAAFLWAAEDRSARRLGLITMRVVELALRAALRPDDRSIDEAWKEQGQSQSALEEVRARLGPIVLGWPGEVRLAHFGAVRGLNDMADVDCLVTLGDPWPNLGEVRNDVAFLGLDEVWEARLEALCRAELEQAHGRLRTVHRARPGRALHVGNVLPGGSGWTAGKVAFRHLDPGRPKAESSTAAAEVAALTEAAGGVLAVAKHVGCSRSALYNYQRGRRSIPADLEERLRVLVAQAAQTQGMGQGS